MPRAWSLHSKEALSTCHPSIKMVMNRALELSPIDFCVLEGHRGPDEQDAAFARGESKLRWPHGKHNQIPSAAVDIAPTPIDWKDRERFILVAGAVLAAAALLGVKLRWGGDWNSDGRMADEKFRDLGHFELLSIPVMGGE